MFPNQLTHLCSLNRVQGQIQRGGGVLFFWGGGLILNIHSSSTSPFNYLRICITLLDEW